MKATSILTNNTNTTTDGMNHSAAIESTNSQQKETKMKRLFGAALFTLTNVGITAFVSAIALTGAISNHQIPSYVPQPTGDGGGPQARLCPDYPYCAGGLPMMVPSPTGDGGSPVAFLVHGVPSPTGDGGRPQRVPSPIGDGGKPTDVPTPIGDGGSPVAYTLIDVPTPIGDGGKPTDVPTPVGDGGKPVAQVHPIAVPSPVGDGGRPVRVPTPVGDGGAPTAWTCETCPPRG